MSASIWARRHLRTGSLASAFKTLRSGVFRLREIHHIMETRRLLAAMDERMLGDIGISRGQAQHEINRKPWDVTPPDDER